MSNNIISSSTLNLSEYDLVYPPKHEMPKEQRGFRLCKLIQYPANEEREQSAWLFTTAFSSTLKFKGLTLSVSSWSRNQETTKTSDRELSAWSNEGTLEDFMRLIEDGIGYVYLHESLAIPPLTVGEYEDYLKENLPTSKKDSSSQSTANYPA